MARLLILFSILVAAACRAAALPAAGELYWNKVLPNTPIPGAIKLILPPADDYTVVKSGTTVTVGKGGVAVNTVKPKPAGGASGTSVNVGHGGVNVNTGNGKPAGGTGVNVGHGGVSVNTGEGKPGGGTGVNVGHGGVTVITPPKKKPVLVNVRPFIYRYEATDTQIHDDTTTTLFFLEKDLHPGAKMTLHFTPITPGAAFISRRESDSIPFTSSKLPEILARFSVEPDSPEAADMKETLSECEQPAVQGESKRCATSLESMVDFSTARLGTRNVQAVSTETDRADSPKQLYTVVPSGAKRLSMMPDLVVCHSQTYAYAVFYCHATRASRAYEVSMVGEDGTGVKAVAVCHADTSAWNPKHIAFRVLNVKPGTVPVCHFLPQDHVVWSARTRL